METERRYNKKNEENLQNKRLNSGRLNQNSNESFDFEDSNEVTAKGGKNAYGG